MDTQYFESRKGQISLRNVRMRRAITIILCDHEPKSKQSITKSEKQSFQNAVVSQMKSLKRRAFKSDIVLEISFSVGAPNPPAIHKLAKNYLDILSKPVSGSGIVRKNILYDDDSQIKILIVNYSVGSPLSFFNIVIRALPMKDFLAEFVLLGRIERDGFVEEGFSYNSRNDDLWDDLRESLEFDVGEAKKTLDDMKDAKAKLLKKMGEKHYEDLLSYWQSHLQRCVLRASQMNLERCLLLFLTLSGPSMGNSAISSWMVELDEQVRDLVVGRMFSIDLKDWPSKSGQTKAFKARIDSELDSFKDAFPDLVELKTLLSLTILFVAPRGRPVDADNIARRIIPKVNDFFKPPSRLLDRSKDKKQLKELRIPKHSVVRYEVIVLPRSKSDPDAGFVRLVFGDGLDNRGIWSAMDSVIDGWVETVEREY